MATSTRGYATSRHASLPRHNASSNVVFNSVIESAPRLERRGVGGVLASRGSSVVAAIKTDLQPHVQPSLGSLIAARNHSHTHTHTHTNIKFNTEKLRE